ncbi:MAG: hypothetical protein CMN84_05930 [Spongiibacteraceae bacterium]|nr:hypothetical protein [Spongiibacteraceae bacterium]
MHSGHIKLVAGDHPTFNDRDIMSACNHLTIRRMAGWKVCGKRSANRQFTGLNSSGFLPHSHLLKDWYMRCCEMMIERLNETQAKITRLSDQQEIIVTTNEPYTNLRGQADRYMHIEGFFGRKIKSFRQENATGTALFSDDGDENKIVMFGGRSYSDNESMDEIWSAINSKVGLVEEEETTYENQQPWSPEPGKLIVRVDDFSDEESGILIEPLLNEEGDIIQKRKSFVDWEKDLGLSPEEILDVSDGSKIEHRNEEQSRDVIVQVKS